jgi:hypothetical protein
MAELVRHRQTKGSETDRLSLNHRVTPRLHTSPPVRFPAGFHFGDYRVYQEFARAARKDGRSQSIKKTQPKRFG